MTDHQKCLAEWAAQQLRLEKANKRNQSVILDALAGLGVETVEVTFDGCGDSGGVEEITVTGGTEELTGIDVAFEATWYGGGGETGNHPLKEAVEYLCYGLLQIDHCGWENNDGAFGTFRFDVASRQIHLEFNGRYSSYETFSHTFPEEA